MPLLRASGLVFAIVLALACAPAAAMAAPTVKEFEVSPKDLGPAGITAGPDGNLWFATAGKAGVGSSTPAGTISVFKSGVSGPTQEIAAGPDGNLWATEPNDDVIARITTLGAVTEYSVEGEPFGITAGPDGALWFTETANPGAIGRINPTNGKVTQFSSGLTAGRKPLDIAAGSDGALWFTESANPAAIGRITTAGTISEYTTGLTANSKPTGITPGPDGALWFTESASPAAVGRITTAGTITEYTTGLTANSKPTAIATADNGTLYFTETAAPGRIGSITPLGLISELATPTSGSAPSGIAAGPDGNVWLTESSNPGRVAMLTAAPAVTLAAATSVSRSGATLSAEVGANSQATSYRFEYGATTAYGSQTSPASAGSAAGSVTVSTSLSGLAAGSVYHFRAVASNSAGTTYGSDGTVTTLSDPAPVADSLPPLLVATSLLAPGQALSGQPGPAATPAPPSPPKLGRSAFAGVLSGLVTLRTPGSSAARPLTTDGVIPMGSVIDTAHGVLLLTTAADSVGHTQSATLWGGLFAVSQSTSQYGMTTFRLAGGLTCSRTGRGAELIATPSSSGKSSRTLWAKDNHGHFSTRGQNSVATVRGTEWETVDRCDGTHTRVKQGAVSVHDVRRHRTVLVRAGHSYLARP
jgi:virginiamycin B lyase